MANPVPENPTFAFYDNEDANIPLARAMRAVNENLVVSVSLGRFALDPNTEWEDTISRRIDELCELAGFDSGAYARSTPLLADTFPPASEIPQRGQLGRDWSDQTVGEIIASSIAGLNEQNYDEGFDDSEVGFGHSFYIGPAGQPYLLLIDAYTESVNDVERTSEFHAMYGELDIPLDEGIVKYCN